MVLAKALIIWGLITAAPFWGGGGETPAKIATGQTSSPIPTSRPPAHTASPKPASATKPKVKRRKTHLQSGKQPAKSDLAPKVIVSNGGAAAAPTQLTTSAPPQASQKEQSTTQLLDDADLNVKKASDQSFAERQRETVSQIRQYIEQAKAASNSGDVDRAHNLALKANLLSKELLPH